MENLYYHYFIGLTGYQNHRPFVPSLLVEFRKRLNDDVMMEINEMIIAYNTPDAVIDRKTEYADNADRVEVERSFSLAKRCYGLGRITCYFMSKKAMVTYTGRRNSLSVFRS